MPLTVEEAALASARAAARGRHKSYWVRAWRSTAQTIVAQTTDYVSFDRSDAATESGVSDPQGMHNPVGDPTRFFARTVRGLYRVRVVIVLSGSVGVAAGYVAVRVYAASGDFVIAKQFDDGTNIYSFEEKYTFSPGDVLRVEIYNDNGATARDVSSLSKYAPIVQLELEESEQG